jgi:hypothetical protein
MADDVKDIPLNISDFKTIIEEGYLYVDKTRYLEMLLKGQDKYFIVLRPKNFGKTVFLNTLESFFKGEERLFRGLYIHGRVGSFEKFPVVKLNMGLATGSAETMAESITSRLSAAAADEGVELRFRNNPAEALYWLVRDLYRKSGKKVVMLIDEYDKPVMDHLLDPVLGGQMRKALRDLYLVLRLCEPYLHFTFITGVIKLRQFALNTFMSNVTDLTFLEEFSTAFGYTREEFMAYFADRFDPLVERLMGSGKFANGASIVDLRNRIFTHYDGYSFDGVHSVFSPYQINRYFYVGGPRDLWYKADNPRLLKDVMKDDPEAFILSTFQHVPNSEFYNIEVGAVSHTALMFYLGYLTVDRMYVRNGRYYCNLKIQSNEKNYEFSDALYSHYFANRTSSEMLTFARYLIFAIRTRNSQALEAILTELLLKIPMIRDQRSRCEHPGVHDGYDEVERYAPGPKYYDFFDPDAGKDEEATAVLKEIPARHYINYILTRHANEHFNTLFQTALQSVFEMHGFLTTPEILRIDRGLHIECTSSLETILFKVVNVTPDPSDPAFPKTLLNAAKSGLQYLNHRAEGQAFQSPPSRVHRIGVAVSPFDKIRVVIG